jgi:hypothetical protein
MQGLHVRDIADRAGTSADKLGRVLRFLCSRHIFREVSPNVFSANRISSMLDTGKSHAEIVAKYVFIYLHWILPNYVASSFNKHDNTSGFPALMGHWYTLQYNLKSASIDIIFLVRMKALKLLQCFPNLLKTRTWRALMSPTSPHSTSPSIHQTISGTGINSLGTNSDKKGLVSRWQERKSCIHLTLFSKVKVSFSHDN